ncbi:MAG: hypothetical protein HZC37_28775 [Burkholderiales bacterium]|nr:hypothetical protein [Burkholderiales bacterium]
MPLPSPPILHKVRSALLAGATGLVGRALAAQWPGPQPLHLLVRREVPASGPGQRVHVVDFAALPPLPACEWAFCCLGTTIKVAGSQAAFRAVDHDAVLAFARAAVAAGVTHLAVVSALGADARSRNFYSRTKGEMEAALRSVGLRHLVIARPSLLAGDRASLAQAPRFGEVMALALTRPLARFIPKAWRPIEAGTLARALLRSLADAAPGVTVLESAALQDLGA